MYATGGWVQAGWAQPQLPIYGQAAAQPQVYPQYGFSPQHSTFSPQHTGCFSPQATFQQWPQPAQVPQEVDPVEIFLQELGIQETERVHFGWLAEYGLQEDVLPPGWTSHTDSASGRIFFADTESGTTSWENPVADCLRRTIEIGRIYLSAPSETFFQDQMEILWDQHKTELAAWHGPMMDDEGRHYYINSSNGVSSRQDPRQNTQFFWEVERTILESFRDTLVAPEPEGLPSFGLTEEELLGRLSSTETSDWLQPELESPLGGSSQAPQRRANQLLLDMARERTEQAGRVHREDLKAMYKEMINSLNGIDYVVKDEAEAQRMIMMRKFRERRDELRRKEQEDHQRRYGEEWQRSLQAMEETRRQEEARRKAEADAEEARKAEMFRQQFQERERLQLERRREDEERKVAEEERQRVLAEKATKLEEERRAREIEKAAQEEAQRKVEDARKAREDLIARIREAVHSRNTEQLRAIIVEAEAAGLHHELEPLRKALQQELAARRVTALKARKAAEKLAGDFATAKEAQDVGGPTLAAQWRAAVKEVAKPFDEEQFLVDGISAEQAPG